MLRFRNGGSGAKDGNEPPQRACYPRHQAMSRSAFQLIYQGTEYLLGACFHTRRCPPVAAVAACAQRGLSAHAGGAPVSLVRGLGRPRILDTEAQPSRLRIVTLRIWVRRQGRGRLWHGGRRTGAGGLTRGRWAGWARRQCASGSTAATGRSARATATPSSTPRRLRQTAARHGETAKRYEDHSKHCGTLTLRLVEQRDADGLVPPDVSLAQRERSAVTWGAWHRGNELTVPGCSGCRA